MNIKKFFKKIYEFKGIKLDTKCDEIVEDFCENVLNIKGLNNYVYGGSDIKPDNFEIYLFFKKNWSKLFDNLNCQ